jgi:hypothetical protein
MAAGTKLIKAPGCTHALHTQCDWHTAVGSTATRTCTAKGKAMPAVALCGDTTFKLSKLSCTSTLGSSKLVVTSAGGAAPTANPAAAADPAAANALLLLLLGATAAGCRRCHRSCRRPMLTGPLVLAIGTSCNSRQCTLPRLMARGLPAS